MNTVVSRFVRVGLAVGIEVLALLIMLSASSIGAESAPYDIRIRRPPFTPIEDAGIPPNGVAAGDTTQTATVLWTRGTTAGTVLFEYSTDSTFSTHVLTATATVTDLLQPVKVEITGLVPATPYFYRVADAADASAEGRFRTAAAVGTHTGLRFGVSGDWCGELAPYPSIANADERNLDFFIEHGDTIIAGAATTLEEFRLKHNEVYSTHLGLNAWADLRAATSLLATIDDNNVRDSFAGGAHPPSDPRFDNTGTFINETRLYGNALQAFQEYNPLRDEWYGATGDPRTANKRRLYRFNTYGSDAAVFILDARSFRDEPLPLDNPTDLIQVLTFLTNSLSDTSRTMLGAQQLADLKAGLQQAQADGITWKFVLVPVPIQNLGIFHAADRYEGYAAERTDLLRFIDQNGIDNVVFIAAALHGTIVNNLTYQESVWGPQIPTGAFEVIVGPVAISPPFGPAIMNLAEAYGLVTPEEKVAYEAMSRADKDEFVRQLIDDKLLKPLGYDLVGLDGSGFDAAALQGGYVAVHTYGWTEFEIGQSTQVLTVTTYGIAPYSEAELLANPGDVITRTPMIVSQCVVTPENLTQDEYVLTVGTVGDGTVAVEPNQGLYHYGDVVTLTATANSGWTFVGWSGGLLGSTNPVTVTITGNATITSTFTQDEYTLTVGTVGGGSVTVEPGLSLYHYGDVVTLIATANPGWIFAGWSGALSVSVNPATVTVSGNTVVTATFTQDEYVLTVGTVGDGAVAVEPDLGLYHYGDVVTLTATATPGWTFAGWSGALSGTSNPAMVTITDHTAVTATFITYRIFLPVVVARYSH